MTIYTPLRLYIPLYIKKSMGNRGQLVLHLQGQIGYERL